MLQFAGTVEARKSVSVLVSNQRHLLQKSSHSSHVLTAAAWRVSLEVAVIAALSVSLVSSAVQMDWADLEDHQEKVFVRGSGWAVLIMVLVVDLPAELTLGLLQNKAKDCSTGPRG